jgi:RHS repeat-associated protein
MTRDGRDANSIKDGMVYDNRNLLIEMTLHNILENGSETPTTEIRKLVFDYDEAGNRVRKREYLRQQPEETPPGIEDGGMGVWDLVGDEYYSRDISGKEIAIYHSNDLYQWNVWGTDNVGKITATGDKFFYLKDHLGTIRVVLDENNEIVSAQDFDPWGYPLENRSFQSDNTDYKFTGKQRDKESGYDYFGARYYDARIGRWGGVEPLLEKFISLSPYNYAILNPIRIFDKDGKDIYINGKNNEEVYKYLKTELSGLNLDFNSKTGQILFVSKNGDLTKAEQKFLDALLNGDIIVNLNITDKNKIESGKLFQVGAFEGNERSNGKIVTKQTFNLGHAEIWAEVGGSTVGFSALHEILESYLAAENLPKGYSGFVENFDLWCGIFHNETEKILPDNPEQMVIKQKQWNKDKKGYDYYLKGPVDTKFLYFNSEPK